MNFLVNGITSYSTRCNKVSLSFVDVQNLPANIFFFSMFVPKSVELKEGEVCNLPHWLAQNIWKSNSTSYILKDLVKQGKASVHKRAEKADMVIKVTEAFKAAEALNIEEPVVESGEHVGKPGDTLVTTFKVDKCLKSWETTYSGIWTHKQGFNGNYYWSHPSAAVSLWQLSDSDGHIFILRSSNDGVNSQLYKAFKEGRPVHMKAAITGHTEFRGVKQTNIHVRKADLFVGDAECKEEV